MKPFISTLLITQLFFVGCQIVEEDTNQQDGSPTSAPDITTIDIGSSIIPTDSIEFVRLLNNTSTKVWRTEAFTLETINGFQDCRLDDTMVLHEDGTWEYDGGQDLCFGLDNRRTRSGTYQVDIEQAELIFFDEEGIEYAASIITLEEGVVVLSGVYESLFGDLDVVGRYISQ
jgi:hypothetical protein